MARNDRELTNRAVAFGIASISEPRSKLFFRLADGFNNFDVHSNFSAPRMLRLEPSLTKLFAGAWHHTLHRYGHTFLESLSRILHHAISSVQAAENF
jgi:hypothetical protein